MADTLLRAYFPEQQLKASVVLATDTAREAERLHGLRPAAGVLLAQAIAGASLLASLQKEDTRLNLQLECDGPLRGLLVDAGSDGTLRGYVKNPLVEVEGPAGEFRWRPALGNSGFLSVLRDLGGAEYYRSSVELKAFELARDLEGYFQASDQVPTRVCLAAVRKSAGELASVGGALLQAMPGGDTALLGERGDCLQRALEAALPRPGLTAPALAAALFEGLSYQAVGKTPVRYACTCSPEGVLSMLAALGKAELRSIITEQGQAEVTCHFCSRRHLATRADLEALIASTS